MHKWRHVRDKDDSLLSNFYVCDIIGVNFSVGLHIFTVDL